MGVIYFLDNYNDVFGRDCFLNETKITIFLPQNRQNGLYAIAFIKYYFNKSVSY